MTSRIKLPAGFDQCIFLMLLASMEAHAGQFTPFLIIARQPWRAENVKIKVLVLIHDSSYTPFHSSLNRTNEGTEKLKELNFM
jgi:hypothetical protein